MSAPTTSWWSDGWAWRTAIAAAPFGALAAILHALVLERAAPTEALVAYAVGAMAAAGVGCLLGGSLGAVVTGLAERWRAGTHRVPDSEPDAVAPDSRPDPVAA